MSEQQERPPRVYTPVDDPKLKLFTERNKETNRSSTLSVTYYEGLLGISVFHENNQMPKLNGRLDIMSANEFLTTAETIFRSNEPNKVRWNLFGRTKDGKTGKVGILTAGRAEDGSCYLAAMTDGWQNPVVFKFRSFYQFPRVDMDGNPVPMNEISGGIAIAWCRSVKGAIDYTYYNNYKQPEPRQFGNGNKGNYNKGNYNNNRGGNYSGGGYKPQPQRTPDSSDFSDFDSII